MCGRGMVLMSILETAQHPKGRKTCRLTAKRRYEPSKKREFATFVRAKSSRPASTLSAVGVAYLLLRSATATISRGTKCLRPMPPSELGSGNIAEPVVGIPKHE